MRFQSGRIALIVLFLLAPPVFGCLWDHDTIRMERSRFPSTLELITGKFLRHSPEFYEWRIRDRLKKLETDPTNARLYDDLAVAYDKTKQQDKAIATMLKLEQIQPGRYETYANLGTFYFHSGKFEEGIQYIDKALAINPDAHFGREKYQKLLVQYVMTKRKDGKLTLPLSDKPRHWNQYDVDGFAHYLASLDILDKSDLTRAKAIKGIVGMMRFGNYDSPVLLEALGDLLSYEPNGNTAEYQKVDARLLAARAYLKASMEVSDEVQKKAYRTLAEQTIEWQAARPHSMKEMKLEQVESELHTELSEARQWHVQLRERELSWIQGDPNPDDRFDELYRLEPVIEFDASPRLSWGERHHWWLTPTLTIGIVIGAALAVIVGGFFGIRFLIRPRT